MLTNSEKSRFFLADLTVEVQSIPNTYGYISNLGLFRSAPITQTTFLMDLTDWDVSLFDAVDRDSKIKQRLAHLSVFVKSASQ